MNAQIVSTLGPSSGSEKVLVAMIKGGINIARLNFSWGTHEEHGLRVDNLRKAAKKLKKRILILLDLSGPRVAAKGGHHFDGVSKKILTKKDINDLNFAKKYGVDYVALSYVGCAADVVDLKEELKKKGVTAKVVDKIERKKAFDNLDEILKEADAIMIARGDLGNEIPLEKIPYVQSIIIARAKEAGKPVITATEMMISMVEKSRPSRADVSDVTVAILTGTDAVMLSEETAIGKYPVEVVQMMKRIAVEASRQPFAKPLNSF
ncbi:MAG: hypothetical protein EXS46_00490 [Candidatus Taylorbacteria bacterium]|nr:hypothetical protein [Candidatus Taylorbacteria bacterium]